MDPFLFFLLVYSPLIIAQGSDPTNAVMLGRQELRNMECARLSQRTAHERYPTLVPEPTPRGMVFEATDALVCRQRYVQPGERDPRDEVILSSLRRSVGELVEVAAALGADDTVWHVDAFYPEPRVASKIATAARTALAEGKRQVSNKVPLLAAGDLVVLRELPPEKAYPLACRRYFDQQALGPTDAFLGVMLLDPRETQLHAGICRGGAWRWIR